MSAPPATRSAQSDWAASGLAWLTGPAGGPPDFSRSAVLTRAREIAARFGSHTGVRADAGVLLAGRAALLGLHRAGRISAGGATRLLEAADGWCALTLSRPEDLEALPALIDHPLAGAPWPALRRWAARHPAARIAARAGLLDIPAAALGETAPAEPVIRAIRPAHAPRPVRGAVVADLTSMWAGPLCGQLLARAGATVIKVESPSRPDGTRAGERAFFDWMNGGKLSCAADFDRDADFLRGLLAAADVVLEGSRPAALPRRGLGPAGVAGRPGRVWMRITAHGDGPDGAARTGFGDDAAVAGGLVGHCGGGPVFCADAIADPLTGLQAALTVAESLARGGGEVITLSMAAVAASYAALGHSPPPHGLTARPPARPHIEASGPALGADTGFVRRLVAERTAAC